MWQKQCRLTVADKFFGGGGGGTGLSGDIYSKGGGMRRPGKEQGWIRRFERGRERRLDRYVNRSPLLNTAEEGALDFWNQTPEQLAQFPAFQEQLAGYQGQLGGLFGELGEQSNTLQSWLDVISPTIANRGALTDEQARDADQESLMLEERYGTSHTTGGIGRNVLNRDFVQRGRFSEALNQGRGLLAQEQGVFGMQAGLTGQAAALTGQRAGLLGQEQAFQTGALNQLLGVEGAEVSNFSQLENPILAYLGNLFSGNQQTAIANAQIGAQQGMASDAKTGQLIGSALSSIGSIAGAAAMSDERLKTNIRDTGVESEEGIPLKIYEFATRPGIEFLGPIASDVEKVRPDAVKTDKTSGIKFVEFWKIKAPMIELTPYGQMEAA